MAINRLKPLCNFLKPERFFLIVSLLLTLAYITLFSNLTNYNHGAERMMNVVYHAMAFMGEPRGVPGGFADLANLAAENKPHPKIQFPDKTSAKQIAPLNLLEVLGIVDGPGNVLLDISLHRDRLVDYTIDRKSAHYPLLGYLPFIPPAMLGIALDMPPIIISYMMILFHAIYAVTLGYCTIRLTPILKWAFVFLLLWPTICVNRVSITPDASVVELCFLIVALVMRYRESGSLLTLGKQLLLIALSGITGIIKVAYFLVPAAVCFLPVSMFVSRRAWLRCVLLCIGAAVLLAAAWNFYTAYTLYNYLSDIAASDETREIWKETPNTVSIILSDPLKFYHDLFASTLNEMYLRGAAANLILWNGYVRNWHNWIYRFEYTPLLCATLVALFMLALFPLGDERRFKPLTSVQKMFSALLVFISMLMIATLNYIAYYQNHVDTDPFVVNTVNSFFIQGRYFGPLLPLLLLACYKPSAILRIPYYKALSVINLTLAIGVLLYLNTLMLTALL